MNMQQPFGFGPIFQQPGQIIRPPSPSGHNYGGQGGPPPPYEFASTGRGATRPPSGPQQQQPFYSQPPRQASGYFPGLAPLSRLDHLFIKQEVTDIFFNSQNHFKVLTSNGTPIFTIVEKTGLLTRLFGGQHQSFSLIMKDLGGNDILFMEGSPGFFGSGAGTTVSYQNTRLGSVMQGGDMCNPQYNIIDSIGNIVLIVKSQDNCCCIGSMGTYEFPILTPDGTQIGRIGKEWGGFGRELFTSADTFGINFPMDLHEGIKGVLLAATIMIDFQFFSRR